MNIEHLCLIIVLAPLLGSAAAGLVPLSKKAAHTITIAGVLLSFVLSIQVAFMLFSGHAAPINTMLYTWADGGKWFPFSFHLGFLIDNLTACMLVTVTFVSFLVHIYSIGYMADDPGYQRFFSYISLFTFMMLTLVTANNFLQLFFGWEGVGLVSYLLIGFWYQRESAIQGSLKAFLVNRVGDFGFILGIGLLFSYTDSIDYAQVFSSAHALASQSIEIFAGHPWSVLTVICILLFVGAMGKSAQVPLHVWLPESMEGPTPISALIHAATMVTAGVFMVARISPMIEFSPTALTFILVIGATGALFTGILALVMHDIKRVIAYSTLSQLGYMMVAMGVSAYSAGIFHLMTHACFKALLFLAAGSVIIAMHHEQDMRKMGGLWSKMPITYVTFLIGTLALCALPPFSGYFSKDTIIESVHLSSIPGSSYAYFCVVLGAMVTAMYSIRALLMTFHGTPRMDKATFDHVHETPAVVWMPLVILAIPSVLLGYILYKPMLFDAKSLLANALFILPDHDVLKKLGTEVHSSWDSVLHAVYSLTFWLTLLGIFVAWVFYSALPSLPARVARGLSWIYAILMHKYGFDSLYQLIFVRGTKAIGRFFYKVGDQLLIDGAVVNGSASVVRWFAVRGRVFQNGYLYRYASVMVLGILGFLCWLILH